jgi:mannobiose 2-epimerase
VELELRAILSYWTELTQDIVHGGFYGRLDENNQIDPQAPKGIVLNSRILWAFTAAYSRTGEEKYLGIAQKAYEYILSHFVDTEYGGVYWSVDFKGDKLSDRKQIYGLSFCIYGLSEYYRVTRNREALDQAIALFRLIEQHGYDPVRMGYYEAFSRDWKPLEDLRLSEKDANEKKTMNTHLHVIEAYANLYLVWPDTLLKRQIDNLLEVFEKYIIDARTGHLVLFFDEYWTPRSDVISFGHDIEAAWLLLEAAYIGGDENRIREMQRIAVKTALAATEGLDIDGGLWYEYDPRTDSLVAEKHSWPQAEAMIGFLNAYQLSGNKRFLEQSIASWRFIRQYIRDQDHGEWFWGVTKDHSPMPGQDKAGFWKCPYHNTRACLEVMGRIDSLH